MMHSDVPKGAGKSTVIKMLIDRLELRSPLNGQKFPSPVTSSSNDRVPTTGDVHLYAEPSSYQTQTPLLYADCEGLDGGETIPRGLRHRVKGKDDRSSSSNSELKKKKKRGRHSSERSIVWAVNPETKKREYAVTELYPRLLYTFSDVVVFVLRNPR